ncbi:hypothetical protein GE061_007236 [Apolygus lucorum]|uniref:Uncharacterized protein n=1 Tax=Apolygus lucorum TaxID=248454 RepID=A0A8S9WSX3_APOLU|nr:hypothetical protein GE061_007236 [Apolygus lucorum]
MLIYRTPKEIDCEIHPRGPTSHSLTNAREMTLIGKASRYAGTGGRAIQTVYWRAKSVPGTSETKFIKTRKSFNCGTSDNKPELPGTIQRPSEFKN